MSDKYRVGERVTECLTNIMQDRFVSSRKLGRRTGIRTADIRKFKSGELVPDIAEFSLLLWGLNCSPEDLDGYYEDYWDGDYWKGDD